MTTLRFVHWQEEGGWLGYLQEYPNYWTQGENCEELIEQLKSLYHDMASGEIPGIRRTANREDA